VHEDTVAAEIRVVSDATPPTEVDDDAALAQASIRIYYDNLRTKPPKIEEKSLVTQARKEDEKSTLIHNKRRNLRVGDLHTS
jgi:hypothetical protein